MDTFKQINYILNKKEKFQLVGLLFAMLASALLEIVGISVLLPIIDLISTADSDLVSMVNTSWCLSAIVKLFSLNLPEQRNTLELIIIITVMILYIIKAVYTIFLNAITSRFTNNFHRKLSVSLFETYLFQPYDFYLYTNSADLLRSATSDVSTFVGSLSTLLSLLSDIIFCSAIFVYLLVLDWKVTLIVFALIVLVSAGLLLAVKKRTKAYGKETWWLYSKGIRTIQEALGGIKETKISGRESYFLSDFDSTNRDMASVAFKNSFVLTLPRVIIEAVGMISILAALLIYTLLGVGSSTILSTFSLFAVAIIKLLPYVSRFNGEIGGLRYSMASISSVYHDLQLASACEGDKVLSSKTREVMPFNEKIVIDHVSFLYRGSDKVILDNVFGVVIKGQSTAFCGQSGAGKTTTIDLILGLLKPKSGQILCDSTPVLSNVQAWHRDISYVPQDIYLVDSDIRTNVAFGMDQSLVKDEDVWKALDEAQLGDFVRSLPLQLHTSIGEKGVRLSGGQRQRIGIARALFRNTQIIVFDEATSALDYQTEGEILNTINGLKGTRTLIIITHRLNTIQNCDRIYEVKGGKMTCVKGGELNAH